jgi:hypothetical protein
MYFMTASATTTDAERAPNPRFPERHTPSAAKAKQAAEERRTSSGAREKKKNKNPGEGLQQANAAWVSVGNEEDSGSEPNAFEIEFAVHHRRTDRQTRVCPSGEFNSVT